MKTPSLGAILLSLIPFAAMCFSVSLWDRVDPVVAGLPFNIFWLISWIVLTPLCMWGAYHLEARRTLELIDRRQACVRVKQSLAGLVIVAAFDRDRLAVRNFLAPLLDEYADDRSFAFRRRKIVARPPLRAEACLERDGNPIRA